MLDTAHSNRYIMRSFRGPSSRQTAVSKSSRSWGHVPSALAREKLSSAVARELECQFTGGAPDHRSTRLYLQYHMNFIQVEFKSHHLQ